MTFDFFLLKGQISDPLRSDFKNQFDFGKKSVPSEILHMVKFHNFSVRACENSLRFWKKFRVHTKNQCNLTGLVKYATSKILGK